MHSFAVVVWLGLFLAVPIASGPVRAAILRVDQYGVDGYPTIGAAIDAAEDGDTIIVPIGTYSGQGNTNLSFAGKAITLRSSDPNSSAIVNQTIIACNQTWGFYFHNNEGPDSVLDGFVIRDAYEAQGAAILCNLASPTVQHCIFKNNNAQEGSAMCLLRSHPTIRDCDFQGGGTATGSAVHCDSSNPLVENCCFTNHAGKAFDNYFGSPTVTGCTFADNSFTAFSNFSGNGVFRDCLFENNVDSTSDVVGGGAIYNFSGDIRTEGCQFINNRSQSPGGAIHEKTIARTVVVDCLFRANVSARQGGAIYSLRTEPTLLNCVFTANIAGDVGGALYMEQCVTPSIRDCLFAGNRANTGGAMGLFQEGVVISHCTLADNATKVKSGNGIDCSASSGVRLLNSIVWNGGNEFSPGGRAGVTASYCNITGGWVGVGNIDADPCFAAPGRWADETTWIDGDYTLAPGSPCIDAGDPAYVPGPDETDVAGKPRINGPAVDMGAHEYERPRIIYVDDDAGLGGDGITWTTAYRFLQDALVDANSDAYPCEIRIAQGLYTPDRSAAEPDGTGDPNATFRLPNRTTLMGGHAGLTAGDPDTRDIQFHQTILSGDLLCNDTPVSDAQDLLADPNRADNAFHVVTAYQVNKTSIVDGLSIVGGNHIRRDIGGPRSSESYAAYDRYESGGGLYTCVADIQIRRCTFSHNVGSGYGGAVHCTHGSPTFTGCLFTCNAAASGIPDIPTVAVGGAIGSHYSGLEVRSCRFEDNYCPGTGGAVYSLKGTIALEDCTFTRNSANGGGAFYNADADAALTWCSFLGNRATDIGGALYNGGILSCSQCLFQDNTAKSGGAVNSRSQSTQFSLCIFRANKATSGGAMHHLSSPRLTACVLDGNQAIQGGALYIGGSNATVSNCTLTGNRALEGAAVFGDSSGGPRSPVSAGTLNSCIIYGNDSPPLAGAAFATAFCNIQGMAGGGPGVIDTDPLFAVAGYWDPNTDAQDPNDDIWVPGDYHLQSHLGRWDPSTQAWVMDPGTSPCIDAGDPRVVIGEEPQPHGYRVNMGAYGNTSQASKSPFGRACIQPGHPDYYEWVAVGQPLCWCYGRQCHGDADGRLEGNAKTGYYYTHFTDLNVLLAAWDIRESPQGPGLVGRTSPQGVPYVCADFARNIEGTSKNGFYRVHFSDLYMLVRNWNVNEPPSGPGIPPDCGGALEPDPLP